MPIKVDAEGRWDIVPGVELDEFSQGKLAETIKELSEEREAVSALIS